MNENQPSVPLKDYVQQQVQDVRHAVDVALAAVEVEGVPLRQFIEAILAEKDRALAMADDEREKAASALRGEQQRALDQAGRERDKAAENLKIELARAISEGDERLREHISNQITQLNAALVSADKLEISRIQMVSEQSGKAQAIANERFVAAERAISKAENATEERFRSVNEFRSTLTDQTKTFIPRELAEKTTDSLDDRLRQVQQWQAKIVGAMALIGVFVPLLTAVAVYYLTRHAIPVAAK